MRKSGNTLLLAVLVSLALSAVSASAASAGPLWRFNGNELLGGEKVKGVSIDGSLTVPGVTTTCKRTVLTMKISNAGGAGKGEVTKLALSECHTPEGSPCAVESIATEKLPWLLHAATFIGKDYVIIEGIHIGITYAGPQCAIAGVPVVIAGTAGGLFENATSTLTFNGTTFETTGTSLKVGATAVDWDALFALEATGAHSAETLGLF
jgi:hypothetical protein